MSAIQSEVPRQAAERVQQLMHLREVLTRAFDELSRAASGGAVELSSREWSSMAAREYSLRARKVRFGVLALGDRVGEALSIVETQIEIESAASQTGQGLSAGIVR